MNSSAEHIVITLVNYFNETEVITFIRNYLSNDFNKRLIVYVVDNGTENPDLLNDEIKNYQHITLINPGKNSGYFGAFNIALNNYKKQNINSSALFILCNTDLIIESKDWKEKLLNASRKKELGIIGTSLKSSLTGKNQNPFLMNRMPESKINRLISISKNYSYYIIYQSLHYIKARIWKNNVFHNADEQTCYAAHGAFICITDSFVNKAGSEFDNAPFLYGEELFLAELCRLHKLETIILPSVKIIHAEHSTTGIYKSAKHIKLWQNALKKIKSSFY